MKLMPLLLIIMGSLPCAQSFKQQPQRIIIFMLDDVGADALAQIATPNIDALAASGVSFTRAYSHAWCKPSRDSLLRGSWDGVARGESCGPVDQSALSTNTSTFVASLQEAGYLTGLIGKWHVGRAQSAGLPWWFAPHAAGFDHWWAGTSTSNVGNCSPNGFNNVEDGVFDQSPLPETLRQRNRLFDLMLEADNQGKPLFAIVGFTDAHSPWNAPPKRILPANYRIPNFPTDRDLFEAEVVSLDFVIGQVVARLAASDLVIVISENGTPVEVIKPASPRAKTTVYEGGVRVPLIFSGGGLSPMLIDDPVQLYDIGATLLKRLDVPGPRGNGRDMLGPAPEHAFAFVQNPSPTSMARAIIERRYKLIEQLSGLEFYDLLLDPKESTPLPLIGHEFERLKRRLDHLPGA